MRAISRNRFFRISAYGTMIVCLAMLLAGLYSEWKRRGPFWQNYQQIQFGMSQQEVEAILGPPFYQDLEGGAGANYVCVWISDQQRIVVYFNFGPGSRAKGGHVVTEKKFLPEHLWEQMREWWRDK